MADALQGQTGGRGEADRYRHFDAPTLYKAIKRVRVPKASSGGRRKEEGNKHADKRLSSSGKARESH